MNYSTCVGLLLLGAISCYAQPEWQDKDDLPQIMNILTAEGAGAAMTHAEQRDLNPYDVGLKYLRQGQYEFAKRWYYELGRHTGEHQYYYGFAYVEWKSGDLSGALIDAAFLLEKKPPAKIRARTHYLIGSINLAERKITQAKDHFESSLRAYEGLNLQGGVYLCNVMLADAAIYERQFDLVEPFLQRALDANELIAAKGKRPYSRGPYYEILGKSNFWQGHFETALEMELKAKDQYLVHNKPQWARTVNVRVALLHFLVGDPKKAHDISNQIWRELRDDSDQAMLFAYNEVTQALLANCANDQLDFQGREQNIKAWALASPGGKDLLELWEMVKKAPCPPMNKE